MIDKKILKVLKSDVNKAFRKGEIPVSAIIVDDRGNVISHAWNCRQRAYDVIGHAEILAIRKAERKIKDWRLNGYTMYVTLEPCNMCSMFIKECRLDQVFYFLPKKLDDSDIIVPINKCMLESYDEEKKYFNDLLTSFFNNKR